MCPTHYACSFHSIKAVSAADPKQFVFITLFLYVYTSDNTTRACIMLSGVLIFFNYMLNKQFDKISIKSQICKHKSSYPTYWSTSQNQSNMHTQPSCQLPYRPANTATRTMSALSQWHNLVFQCTWLSHYIFQKPRLVLTNWAKERKWAWTIHKINLCTYLHHNIMRLGCYHT